LNSSAQAISAYAALYAPSAAAQAKTLPDIADALHTQLCDLSVDPTPERAEAVAANLVGAHRAILKLREALLREQEVPDGITI